jgi:hypothetical protein
MMIGIKKESFCADFKNLYHIIEKMSPKKVNIKELHPLCFFPYFRHPSSYFVAYSSSVMLFYALRSCVITKA